MAEYYVTIEGELYRLVVFSSDVYYLEGLNNMIPLNEAWPMPLDYWKLKGVISCEEEI